jgi:hypothetical protein
MIAFSYALSLLTWTVHQSWPFSLCISCTNSYTYMAIHPTHFHPAVGGSMSTFTWHTDSGQIGISNWTIFFTVLDICLVITLYWQHCLAVTMSTDEESNIQPRRLVLFIVTAMSTSKPAKLSIITKSREDRHRNGKVRNTVNIYKLQKYLETNRLKWFCHVKQMMICFPKWPLITRQKDIQ